MVKTAKKRLWWTLGIILFILIALRIALEPIALHYVNKALANLEGYKGEVKDIDIALYRGAYRIESLIIKKIDGDFPEPFVNIPEMDISIEWKAIWHGAIVGEIVMEEPVLIFAKNTAGENQAGEDGNWLETLDALIPIKINSFEIKNGKIKYQDLSATPKVNIEILDLYGTATNLSTVLDEDKKLPSRIEATANTSGNGGLTLEMDLNMLKEIPDFDLDLSAEHVELPFLNDFTEAYAHFTFKEGTLDVFSEIAMDDGQYKGYVKPILKDIKVIDLDDKSTTFWRKTWEVVVGATMKIFQNQKEEQFATEVPFSGNMTGSDVGIVATIGNVLKNAFVEAFDAQIDNKVDINSIKQEDEKKGLFDFLKKDKEK